MTRIGSVVKVGAFVVGAFAMGLSLGYSPAARAWGERVVYLHKAGGGPVRFTAVLSCPERTGQDCNNITAATAYVVGWHTDDIVKACATSLTSDLGASADCGANQVPSSGGSVGFDSSSLSIWTSSGAKGKYIWVDHSGYSVLNGAYFVGS